MFRSTEEAEAKYSHIFAYPNYNNKVINKVTELNINVCNLNAATTAPITSPTTMVTTHQPTT